MQPTVAAFALALMFVPVALTAPVGPKMTKASASVQGQPLQQREQRAEAPQSSCMDDSTWADADGDGCAVYAKTIAAGDLTQEEACSYSNGAAKSRCRATCGMCALLKTQGSATADAANTLRREPSAQTEVPSTNLGDKVLSGAKSVLDTAFPALLTQKPTKKEEECVDEPMWSDAEGDGCDAYAFAIRTEQLTRLEACGLAPGSIDNQNGGASKHCRATCGTCDTHQNFLEEAVRGVIKGMEAAGAQDLEDTRDDVRTKEIHNTAPVTKTGTLSFADHHVMLRAPKSPLMQPQDDAKMVHQDVDTVSAGLAMAVSGKDERADGDACVDDPEWRDKEGDGCAAYVEAIEHNELTRAEACGDAPGSEGNQDGKAKAHCRATCGTCKGSPIQLTPRTQPLMKRRDPIKFVAPPAKASPLPPIVNKEACIDDQEWRDGDGDGCGSYSLAIAKGLISRAEACGDAPGALNNQDGAAKEHCPAMCGACTPRPSASHGHVKLGPLPGQSRAPSPPSPAIFV